MDLVEELRRNVVAVAGPGADWWICSRAREEAERRTVGHRTSDRVPATQATDGYPGWGAADAFVPPATCGGVEPR
jgi:hypothetical protein